MNRAILLAALLALPLLASPALAEPNWLPVCKDKDVRVGPYVWLHLGIDCYPGIWVEVCPPGYGCTRIAADLA